MDPRSERASRVDKDDPPVVRDPLFRPEAIAERRSQWLGTVLLAPTISQNLFVVFAATAVAAILSLLFFAEFSRSERVKGWLVPENGLVVGTFSRIATLLRSCQDGPGNAHDPSPERKRVGSSARDLLTKTPRSRFGL